MLPASRVAQLFVLARPPRLYTREYREEESDVGHSEVHHIKAFKVERFRAVMFSLSATADTDEGADNDTQRLCGNRKRDFRGS